MSDTLEREYRAALTESLIAGHERLRAGASAIDAAEVAVQVMEDSPLFNAGRGSNFDERGVVAMDASIMDGHTLGAGAVAGVTDVRWPISLARAVMDESEHVFLIGDGAEAFARSRGIESTDGAFFHTDRRWAELEAARLSASKRPNVIAPSGTPIADSLPDATGKSGTVGAVALDREGRLAAATSTGGMANKTWGRVGDSPVIGAGTYASHRVAVSCTGWGEYFLRNAVAYDVHARMAYGGASLSEAVRGVVFGTLEEQVPGAGGLIAIDADGHVEFCFNTPGMYRGSIGPDGESEVDIYGG